MLIQRAKDFPRLSIALALLGCPLTLSVSVSAQTPQQVDLAAMFTVAERDRRVGRAHKTKAVDARPAQPGEIIVTMILGEGKETQSPPAATGDMVVRNRCPQTGNEQFLVTASKFSERYEGPVGAADGGGWRPYRPRGTEMLYFVVRPSDGSFTFTAPWGEPMVARPKDAIVRNPTDHKDMYRIAAAAFDCSYDILKAPAAQ